MATYQINAGCQFEIDNHHNSEEKQLVSIKHVSTFVSVDPESIPEVDCQVCYTIDGSCEMYCEIKHFCKSLNEQNAIHVKSPMASYDAVAHQIASGHEFCVRPDGGTFCRECGNNRAEGHKSACTIGYYFRSARAV